MRACGAIRVLLKQQQQQQQKSHLVVQSSNLKWSHASKISLLQSHLALKTHSRIPSQNTLWGFIDSQQRGDFAHSEDSGSCLNLKRMAKAKKERWKNWAVKKSICFGQHSSPGSIIFGFSSSNKTCLLRTQHVQEIAKSRNAALPLTGPNVAIWEAQETSWENNFGRKIG